jgi:hypothetical protein
MWTTGLLTLNIHDSLTFEGTELCLNPDLFSTDHGSQRTRAAPHGHHEDANRGVGGFGIGLSASSNSGHTGGVPPQPGPPPPLSLAVGDMVEIRVWDPLPKEHGVKSPTFSTATRKSHGNIGMRQALMTQHHQQLSASSLMSGIPHAGSSVSDSYVPPATDNNLSSFFSMPSIRARPTSSGNNPSQHPDSSDPVETDGIISTTSSREVGTRWSPTGSPSASNADDSSTINKSSLPDDHAEEGDDDQPPTKTVVTPILMGTTPPSSNLSALQNLRPILARSRTSTADGHITPLVNNSSTKPPKPSMIHRRASSTSTAAAPHRSPRTSSLLARHTRDISDVTMDPHQLSMDMHPAEIHDNAATTVMLDDSMMVGSDIIDNAWPSVSSTHRLRLSFVIKVTEKTLTSLRGNSRTQISMLRQVADLYSLSSYDIVTVHRIEVQDENEVLKAVSADFVVVTIKDQFISRGDMVLFQTKLIGSWIYEGQRLTETTRGIKAHAREIRHGNFSAKSGIVTDKTMITFRSRSARIIWLVQLSSEMWDYASPYEHQFEPESVCEIYFDQWIRFLYKLFTKWKELEVGFSYCSRVESAEPYYSILRLL